jgi:hypothetical protein
MEAVRENSTSTLTREMNWPKHWLPKPWVLALHKKFSLLYLAKFANSFPDQETVNEWSSLWAEGLAGIDGEQVKFGLSYCAQKHEWPPTVAEFRACCEARPRAIASLPRQARIDPQEGIKRVAAITAKLQSKPIDGRAYWRRVLDNPTVTTATLQFAHEALANLSGGKEAA